VEEGSNWSLGSSPTASDDPDVSPLDAGAVVTHSAGSDTVHDLISNGSLRITGGSVTVTGDLGGTVRQTSGGTLILVAMVGQPGRDPGRQWRGVVDLSGMLDNTGHTLTVTGDGTVNLAGTLRGGVITLTGGRFWSASQVISTE